MKATRSAASVGSLAVALGLAVAGIAPAAGLASPSHHRRPAVTPAATTDATLALMPDGDNGGAAWISNFGANDKPVDNQVPTKYSVTGTAIGTLGGTALIATGNRLTELSKITSDSDESAPVTLGKFAGEGAKAAIAEPTGVAMGATAALVAVNESGVIQLRRHGQTWTLDKRVAAEGTNADGKHHKPGFIPIRGGSPSHPRAYTAIAISRIPTKTGKYLGLAIDRTDHRLAVIGGVGTPHPSVLAQLSSPDLVKLGTGNLIFGDGGVAFSPVTATRAVVATPSGVAVLDLAKPKHPKLFTSTGKSGTASEISSVAVAPDGDQVVLGRGNGLVDLDGLLTRHTLRVTGFEVPDVNGGIIFAVAFLADGSLAVQRVSEDTKTNTLTAYFDVQTPDPDGGFDGSQEVPLLGSGLTDALSVSPAPVPVSFAPVPHVVATVGHHLSQPLPLLDGVGVYSYDVTSGHLPAGLRLHKHHLTGTPTAAGSYDFTLRALSTYGGAAFVDVHVHVKSR